MSSIVNPDIEAYLRQLYETPDDIRHEMEALAQQDGFPIVGPLVGRHLLLLAQAIQARQVFELGSGFGYSALFFARAVGPEGRVQCTDLDPQNVSRGTEFLTRAGLAERVTYHQEEATAALRRVGGTYDIIYCDIDKDGYPETIDLVHAHLRPGGLFITDNVLWGGRILDPHDESASTRGILEFNRRLFAHPGFVASINPTRDGVAVALKV